MKRTIPKRSRNQKVFVNNVITAMVQENGIDGIYEIIKAVKVAAGLEYNYRKESENNLEFKADVVDALNDIMKMTADVEHRIRKYLAIQQQIQNKMIAKYVKEKC